MSQLASTVQIQPLNLAEIIAQRQQLEMGRQRMAMAQEEQGQRRMEAERQQRLSDIFSQGQFASPEQIQQVAAVDPGAAMRLGEYANTQARNKFADSKAHIDMVGKLSSAAMDQLQSIPREQWEQALPAVQEQIIQGATEADPQFGQHLAQNRQMLTLDNIAHRARAFGEWKDPGAELTDYREKLKAKAEIEQQYPGAGGSESFAPLPTSDGYFSFNRRTGKGDYVTDAKGNVIGRPDADPELQKQLAAAKASGKGEGEAQSKAQTDIGKTIDQAEYAKQLLDELVAHPGKSSIVGAPSMSNPVAKLYAIPGTQAAGFKSRLEQIAGQNFLQAFQTLKGGGQITEIEGKKATDAIGRLQTSQSEAEFDQAAAELKGIIDQGVQRARQSAGGNFGPASDLSMTVPKAGQSKDDDDISDLLEKYK